MFTDNTRFHYRHPCITFTYVFQVYKFMQQHVSNFSTLQFFDVHSPKKINRIPLPLAAEILSTRICNYQLHFDKQTRYEIKEVFLFYISIVEHLYQLTLVSTTINYLYQLSKISKELITRKELSQYIIPSLHYTKFIIRSSSDHHQIIIRSYLL